MCSLFLLLSLSLWQWCQGRRIDKHDKGASSCHANLLKSNQIQLRLLDKSLQLQFNIKYPKHLRRLSGTTRELIRSSLSLSLSLPHKTDAIQSTCFDFYSHISATGGISSTISYFRLEDIISISVYKYLYIHVYKGVCKYKSTWSANSNSIIFTLL